MIIYPTFDRSFRLHIQFFFEKFSPSQFVFILPIVNLRQIQGSFIVTANLIKGLLEQRPSNVLSSLFEKKFFSEKCPYSLKGLQALDPSGPIGGNLTFFRKSFAPISPEDCIQTIFEKNDPEISYSNACHNLTVIT